MDERYNKLLGAYKKLKKKLYMVEDMYFSHMRTCAEREAHIKYLEWKVKDLEERLNYDDRKRL